MKVNESTQTISPIPPSQPISNSIFVKHITSYDSFNNTFIISPKESYNVKLSKKDYLNINFKDESTNKSYTANIKVRNLIELK